MKKKKMTTQLLERGARWVVALFALLTLTCLLAACGPGSGGTGTGPVNGGILMFSGTSLQGAMSSSAPGNCAPACGAVDLVVQDAKVELATDCRIFSHTGEWGVAANGSASVRGTLTTTAGSATSTAPATLDLQFSDGRADSERVTATILDESGRAVLGPFALRKGAAIAPAFGSCPAR
jgi:hypothetical protein